MTMAKMKHTKLDITYIDYDTCLVNNDLVKLSFMGGCRRKAFYYNSIIKFDDDYFIEQGTGSQNAREIELWNEMDKKDRKYFPKLLQYSKKDEYIVQERILFKRGRKSRSHYDTVWNLIEKYDLQDIDFCGENDNWGVRADTGLPVIYDYGYYQ